LVDSVEKKVVNIFGQSVQSFNRQLKYLFEIDLIT